MKPFFLLLTCLLALTACDKSGTNTDFDCDSESISLDGDYDADRATELALLDEIMVMVTDRSARKGSQCYSVEIGNKACGGPSGYIIYSSKNVDTDVLEEKVCYYTAFQRAINVEYGLFSDCAVEAAPAVELRDGNCTEANG